jgi:hypothetical protein
MPFLMACFYYFAKTKEIQSFNVSGLIITPEMVVGFGISYLYLYWWFNSSFLPIFSKPKTEVNVVKVDENISTTTTTKETKKRNKKKND